MSSRSRISGWVPRRECKSKKGGNETNNSVDSELAEVLERLVSKLQSLQGVVLTTLEQGQKQALLQTCHEILEQINSYDDSFFIIHGNATDNPDCNGPNLQCSPSPQQQKATKSTSTSISTSELNNPPTSLDIDNNKSTGKPIVAEEEDNTVTRGQKRQRELQTDKSSCLSPLKTTNNNAGDPSTMELDEDSLSCDSPSRSTNLQANKTQKKISSTMRTTNINQYGNRNSKKRKWAEFCKNNSNSDDNDGDNGESDESEESNDDTDVNSSSSNSYSSDDSNNGDHNDADSDISDKRQEKEEEKGKKPERDENLSESDEQEQREKQRQKKRVRFSPHVSFLGPEEPNSNNEHHHRYPTRINQRKRTRFRSSLSSSSLFQGESSSNSSNSDNAATGTTSSLISLSFPSPPLSPSPSPSPSLSPAPSPLRNRSPNNKVRRPPRTDDEIENFLRVCRNKIKSPEDLGAEYEILKKQYEKRFRQTFLTAVGSTTTTTTTRDFNNSDDKEENRKNIDGSLVELIKAKVRGETSNLYQKSAFWALHIGFLVSMEKANRKQQRLPVSGKEWSKFCLKEFLVGGKYADDLCRLFHRLSPYPMFFSVAVPITTLIHYCKGSELQDYLAAHRDEAEFWKQKPPYCDHLLTIGNTGYNVMANYETNTVQVVPTKQVKSGKWMGDDHMELLLPRLVCEVSKLCDLTLAYIPNGSLLLVRESNPSQIRALRPIQERVIRGLLVTKQTDLVIFPLHLEVQKKIGHWLLVAIDQSCHIMVVDSLNGNCSRENIWKPHIRIFAQLMRQYVSHEEKEKEFTSVDDCYDTMDIDDSGCADNIYGRSSTTNNNSNSRSGYGNKERRKKQGRERKVQEGVLYIESTDTEQEGVVEKTNRDIDKFIHYVPTNLQTGKDGWSCGVWTTWFVVVSAFLLRLWKEERKKQQEVQGDKVKDKTHSSFSSFINSNRIQGLTDEYTQDGRTVSGFLNNWIATLNRLITDDVNPTCLSSPCSPITVGSKTLLSFLEQNKLSTGVNSSSSSSSFQRIKLSSSLSSASATTTTIPNSTTITTTTANNVRFSFEPTQQQNSNHRTMGIDSESLPDSFRSWNSFFKKYGEEKGCIFIFKKSTKQMGNQEVKGWELEKETKVHVNVNHWKHVVLKRYQQEGNHACYLSNVPVKKEDWRQLKAKCRIVSELGHKSPVCLHSYCALYNPKIAIPDLNATLLLSPAVGIVTPPHQDAFGTAASWHLSLLGRGTNLVGIYPELATDDEEKDRRFREITGIPPHNQFQTEPHDRAGFFADLNTEEWDTEKCRQLRECSIECSYDTLQPLTGIALPPAQYHVFKKVPPPSPSITTFEDIAMLSIAGDCVYMGDTKEQFVKYWRHYVKINEQLRKTKNKIYCFPQLGLLCLAMCFVEGKLDQLLMLDNRMDTADESEEVNNEQEERKRKQEIALAHLEGMVKCLPVLLEMNKKDLSTLQTLGLLGSSTTNNNGDGNIVDDEQLTTVDNPCAEQTCAICFTQCWNLVGRIINENEQTTILCISCLSERYQTQEEDLIVGTYKVFVRWKTQKELEELFDAVKQKKNQIFTVEKKK